MTASMKVYAAIAAEVGLYIFIEGHRKRSNLSVATVDFKRSLRKAAFEVQ
jgi:hypothetical protein